MQERCDADLGARLLIVLEFLSARVLEFIYSCGLVALP
jgi:hypothetical protein